MFAEGAFDVCQGSFSSLFRVEMKSGPQEATGRWSTEESLDGEGKPLLGIDRTP